MNQFVDFLGFIIVFGSVIFLAYITTKYVGKRATQNLKGKHMQVIETLKLGVDKQLFIIKAGDKHILLSSSGKNLQQLCEINIDEGEVQIAEQKTGMNEFKGILDRYISAIKPQQGFVRSKPIKRRDAGNEQRDFAKNIQKLQNINKKIDSEDVGHEINEKN